MIVCIDTNVVLSGRQASHPYFPIINGAVAGKLTWVISNSIRLEYEEIMTANTGADAWSRFDQLLNLLSVTTETLIRVNPSFQFRVIPDDADDNKFTDCAIAAHADYIITSDHHFAPLADAGYKPQPITPEAFIERYRNVHL